MSDSERHLAQAIARLAYCNPFLPERVESERQVLGVEFVDTGEVWHARTEINPNIERIRQRVEELTARLEARPSKGRRPKRDELRLYRDLVIYRLYSRHEDRFLRLLDDPKRTGFYTAFEADYDRIASHTREFDPSISASHLFAFFFQVRRAFHLIFRRIVGGSMPAARLRAAVWQSVFTRDMRRYRRSLYLRMGDLTTLITGPSGTGKEIVARAVGMSRYIPFKTKARAFAEDFESSFFPLNLSALSPTLIESELFGHRRGAFTGALEDRPGWLEVCPPLGTVFLDEIGDVDTSIQVKLLRVLETRRFQRLGEAKDRQFEGKIIAATNRDLETTLTTGRMREDFYYRICSDLIRTPSLEEQLRDAPGELARLVRFLAERAVGETESKTLARECERWIAENLGGDYTWPGNVRELDQCVRNIMVRGSYQPRQLSTNTDDLAASLSKSELTLEELTRRYIAQVYSETGSYLGTARRLGIDRRTVKARVDHKALGELASKSDSVVRKSR